MNAGRPRRIGAAVLLGALLAAGPAGAQTPWAVREAGIRGEIRLREAPADPDAGTEIDVPDFGLVKPGSGGYALLDAGGRPVPLAVVWQGEGRETLLLARDLQPGQSYFLYVGGVRGAAWYPKTSLWLETRRLASARAEPPGTPGAMQAAWNGAAAQSQGAAFVDQVFAGDNPHGEPTFFVSHFSGYLAPTKTDVELFTNSAESSFVLVNDQPFTDWTGAPSANVWDKALRAKKLAASTVPVKIDYYQAKTGGLLAPNMTLGWRKPGGHLEVIPAAAFLHPGKADVGPFQARGGAPVPVPEVTPLSYVGVGGGYLYEVRCRVEPAAFPGGVQWDFDDGATLAGAEVTRIMSGVPGTQHITVRAQRGTDPGEPFGKITRRIEFYGPPPGEIEGRRERVRYVALLTKLNEGSLDAAMLAAALPLLFEAGTDAQAAVFANAWLARKPDLRDPLWLAAYAAHARALGDPAKAAAEVAANSAARQAHDEPLDLLEMELLVFQGHDLASLPRVRQLAFRLGQDKGKLGEIRLGDLYRLNGDTAHAAEHYRAAQPPDASGGRSLPAEDQAYALTVEDLLRDGARQDALDTLAKWEVVHPIAKLTTNYPVLRARAVALFGRWREALTELESFAANHADSPYEIEVDYDRARALYELGRKDEARKLWKALAANYPKSELAKPSLEWADKP